MALAILLCPWVGLQVFYPRPLSVVLSVGKSHICDYRVSLRLRYHIRFNTAYYMVSVLLCDDANVVMCISSECDIYFL